MMNGELGRLSPLMEVEKVEESLQCQRGYRKTDTRRRFRSECEEAQS